MAGGQTLHAGDAFFYRPGEWHRHRPLKSEGWTLFWIAFNGDLPYRWMNDGAFIMEGSKPIIKSRDLFEQQFERLLVTAHQTPTWNSEELSWQAIGLLSHFVTDHKSARPQVSSGCRPVENLRGPPFPVAAGKGDFGENSWISACFRS